jgi:hypothetical protein
VIRYEDLTGNPATDAGFVTGIGLFPNVTHQVKLWSKEDKEKMIGNMDEVRSLFEAYCKILGYPDGNMVF